MWGGITYYNASSAADQIEAFHRFVADPEYDTKAYIYQSFGFRSGTLTVLNDLAYREATPELPAKLKSLNEATPSLFSTVRTSNLSDFLIAQAADSPGGLRYVSVTFFLVVFSETMARRHVITLKF